MYDSHLFTFNQFRTPIIILPPNVSVIFKEVAAQINYIELETKYTTYLNKNRMKKRGNETIRHLSNNEFLNSVGNFRRSVESTVRGGSAIPFYRSRAELTPSHCATSFSRL